LSRIALERLHALSEREMRPMAWMATLYEHPPIV
jgi:hypothetical protein